MIIFNNKEMSKFIYGISDKTGSCPFYTTFFEKESDALKELEKQVDYAHLEFGMENLKIEGSKVYEGKKIVFSVDRFILK